MGFMKMFGDREDNKVGNSNEYYDIKADDKHRAWLKREHIEKI